MVLKKWNCVNDNVEAEGMRKTNRQYETSISKSCSYMEVGEFWDEHDLGDYWSNTRKVKFDFVLEPEATYDPISKPRQKDSVESA
jgi:hypothetical protein